MEKFWKLKRGNLELESYLSKELGISSILTQILINRGVNTSEDAFLFLKGDLSYLPSPYLLPDMDKAVQRIKEAIRKKEKVFIFSDYDTDGITGCALLISKLKKFGMEIFYYIPNRIKEGYGLNQDIAKFIKEMEVNLLITVDCGTTSFREIEYLKNNSIDTIIIDHHLPKEELPKACALINPKRRDSLYPYKGLSSVGLVWKFCQVILEEDLKSDLDLVCLGTVADLCPLNGENRILVREGIYRLNEKERPGIKALVEVSGLKNRKISSYHISFILVPRINASGRVDKAEKSLKLLLTDDIFEAEDLAKNLNEDNLLRQRLEREVLKEAEAEIERQINFKEQKIIVLAKDNWHLGVLGIVASRILERFLRPAIVISLQEKEARGSCRSIKGFHMLKALNKCKDLLLEFGGHESACGFTILKDNLERFKSQINRIANLTLTPEDLRPTLEIDAEIKLSLLNTDLITSIQNLEPYGVGNPKPLFSTCNLRLKDKPSILGNKTLKLYVTDGNFTYPAIGWGMSDFFDLLLHAERIHLVYTPNLDIWEGEKTIQLEIKDIKID